MTSRRLWLHAIPSNHKVSTDDILWRAPPTESSFRVSIDPELRQLGDVPEANRDMVAFAIAVFLADRTVARPREWERNIDLDVPMYRAAKWRGLSSDPEQMLERLTSDRWSLTFHKRATPPKDKPGTRPEADLVSLFSGGADSLCGAVRALSEKRRVLLVSHWDWGPHSGYQKRLAKWLTERFPGQVVHQQVWIGRGEPLGTGHFANEPSRRSRSLMFISLGAAMSAVQPALPLWIPENGYASLNPPLAGERRGSLSTRSTHPLFLAELRAVMNTTGSHADYTNPFASMTKGEMFMEVKGFLGEDGASQLLSMSHSCAHVRWAAGTGLRPDTQCGVCFGCLVRRAAFHAADLADHTTYLHTAIPQNAQPARVRRTASAEVKTVQYAVDRGIKLSDILAMGLPEGESLDDAVEVSQRGLEELHQFITQTPALLGVG